MKLASYNVENLFSRAKILNLATWADGKKILDAIARFTVLIQKPTYSAADKKAIIALLDPLGLKKADDGPFVILRQNRGHLLKRPRGGAPTVVANGRTDWVGWLDVKLEAVDDTAVEMTGKVIQQVGADVIAVVEVEDRPTLLRFDDQILGPLGAAYDHVMLIDGNDDRGIDVGLMSRANFPIRSMVSHVDDRVGNARVFSRDCPEYEVALPGGGSLWVLVNHFKSKGFGKASENDKRRKAQAKRVREIYEARRAAGADLIAVVGDLNDTPDSDPLSPLLGAGSDLRDITESPVFTDDGRPGTFGNGAKSNKIDYLLLSPALFAKVTGGGIFRQGVWGGTNGTLFPHFPEITKASEAASDHAAVWAEIAV